MGIRCLLNFHLEKKSTAKSHNQQAALRESEGNPQTWTGSLNLLHCMLLASHSDWTFLSPDEENLLQTFSSNVQALQPSVQTRAACVQLSIPPQLVENEAFFMIRTWEAYRNWREHIYLYKELHFLTPTFPSLAYSKAVWPELALLSG